MRICGVAKIRVQHQVGCGVAQISVRVPRRLFIPALQ
jgi:hypothetical protein